jgi:Biopolymer transport protein ExbD/TolR
MRTHQWRPSTALKKRRSKYLSQVDMTGVACIFFFFVFMFLGLIAVPDIRDGQICFCNTKMLLQDLPDQIDQKVRAGSDRKVCLLADARAQYGDVEAAIQQVRLSGIDNVVAVTEQRDPGLPL